MELTIGEKKAIARTLGGSYPPHGSRFMIGDVYYFDRMYDTQKYDWVHELMKGKIHPEFDPELLLSNASEHDIGVIRNIIKRARSHDTH